MKVLFSTTGAGTGRTEEDRLRTLRGMVSAFVNKLVTDINPDTVVLFYTDKTEDMVRGIEDALRGKGTEVVRVQLQNPDDLNSCLKVMMDTTMDYLKEGNSLYFHYTFGTKSMAGALIACATIARGRLVCISGERRGGVVVSGTERILYTDPYLFQQRLIFARIAHFFNAHNYSAALRECESLVEGLVEWKGDLKNVIEAYLKWDLFQHEDALGLLKDSYKRVPMLPKEQVHRNLEFLNRLNRSDGAKKLQFLLADLVENARRRIENSRHDDAVARLYRTVELIAQILLFEKDIEDPIDLGSLDENLKKELIRRYGEDVEKGKLKVGLRKKLEILRDFFGCEVAKEMLEDKKLWHLLTARNSSILAHGFTPVGEDTAKVLFEVVWRYGEKVCKVEPLSSLVKKCRFPEINPAGGGEDV